MTARRLVSIILMIILLPQAVPSRGAAEILSRDLPPNEDIPFTDYAIDRRHARQKVKAVITVLEKPEGFVGNAPIRIRYLLSLPFGSRLVEDSLQQDMTPFEVVALQPGRRYSDPDDKDLELLPLYLTVRLAEDYSYGNYILPGLRLKVSFDFFAKVSAEEKIIELTAEQLNLRKVPILVDVVQPHNSGFIGDSLPFSLEIQLDQHAILLNDERQKDTQGNIQYLSEYAVSEPLVLLAAERRQFTQGSYRLIRWQYDVSLHGPAGKEVELPVPPVVWRPTESETEDIHVIEPDPLLLKIRPITSASDPFKPMKEPARPPLEDILLYKITGVVLAGSCAALLFWISAIIWSFMQHKKAGLRDRPAELVDHTSSPEEERGYWKRKQIKRQVAAASREYRASPGRQNCIRLRQLLAMEILMTAPGTDHIAPRNALAMTAFELAGISKKSEKTDELAKLDAMLCADQYGDL